MSWVIQVGMALQEVGDVFDYFVGYVRQVLEIG
jgi:hypothetical protein